MKLGIIMDPIQDIKITKDSSFAMLLAAQALGWECFYMEMGSLSVRDNDPYANMKPIKVNDDPENWYKFGAENLNKLNDLNIILMRKDPPLDMQYIYTTHILDLAEAQGVKVVNRPAALRNVNEKLYIHWFPDCIAPTLVTSDAGSILEFLQQYKTIILKPLDNMGGTSIFQMKAGEVNNRVIIETLSNSGQRLVMAQKFIEEINLGDKRILMINGDPVPYALARVPMAGEIRGNLAAGGSGKGVELSDNDRLICEKVGPKLRSQGIFFAGLDVIGNYLTEINITSPTCIRELDKLYNINIAGQLLISIKDSIT